jgi:hypothetical protein
MLQFKFKNKKLEMADISQVLYSLINMRQLHIFSNKPKIDMRLFVDFCVFPHFSLNLPELNLKLFFSAVQNNFRFNSGTFRENRGKTQK